MFLFDWKKVYDTAGGNIHECNLIMEMLIKKKVPKNRWDPIYMYSKKSYAGNSFLLHGDVALFNSYKYTRKDLCVYYALASLRSYGEYLAWNELTLDSLHCPVDLAQLKNNRLLVVSEKRISFRYEEVQPENLH